jgi:hypothetical protein
MSSSSSSSLDEHALIADARLTVAAVRLGTLSDEHFEQYLALLRGFDRFGALGLQCVAGAAQRQTPFSNRSRGDWADPAGPQVRLRWVDSPRAPDPWADLQPAKEVVGVVGVCRSADVASLTIAHAELQAAVGAHRFARQGACYRLYVFDPPDDGAAADPGEAELPNVILIPAATARMTTADYLHRLLEDFVSELVEKLDAWVLDLDGNMPVLQTVLDTRSIEESQLIARRRSGRMSKYMGDCALISGSPLDALQLYHAAVDECKGGRDKLWYASALEGQCCAELIEHELRQPPGAERAPDAPRPVEAVRERMIEALDIYANGRLATLENECCLKLAQFLVDAYRHEGVRWIYVMDSLRWAVDFSEDLPVALRLRVLEKIQRIYGDLGCRRKTAFFMQLRARLLCDELSQAGAAAAIYVDLIDHYVHASDGDGEGAKPFAHRRCLTQHTGECNWPTLELCLYNWLSEIAKQQGDLMASALWELRALASPALLSRCLPAQQLESELASVTARLAVAEAEGTSLTRGRQDEIERLTAQVSSLQNSLERSREQAKEQAAMAAAVQGGFGLFPPSCQGKEARPRLLVRMDALDLPTSARPIPLRKGKDDHGPFLYSSFMARDAAKKKKPILWASGEVATVAAQLRNPLSVPIEVVDATLVVSDPFFDASPQSFTLEAGATRTLWLTGVCGGDTSDGGKPSQQKVLGVLMTIFGAVHEYPIDEGGQYVHRDSLTSVPELSDEAATAVPEPEPQMQTDSNAAKVEQQPLQESGGLDVTVVPPMPKLVGRLIGCGPRGEVSLAVGEEKEIKLLLANTGGGRCTAAHLTLSQNALRRDGSALYKAKTKKQIAAEGNVARPDPLSWSETALQEAAPLAAGQKAMVPLRLLGVPGCAAVALTLTYDGGPEVSYGRELSMTGVRLNLQGDAVADTTLVDASSRRLSEDAGDLFRWELVAVQRRQVDGEGVAPAAAAAAAGAGAGGGGGRGLAGLARTQAVPLVETVPVSLVEALPTGEGQGEGSQRLPPERWQWQISSFTFYELRLCVGLRAASTSEGAEVEAGADADGADVSVSKTAVHVDAMGMDGCSCSGAFDYAVDRRAPSDGAGDGVHVHSIGLFFTKPTLAEMTVSVTDHTTGQTSSHRCGLAVS